MAIEFTSKKSIAVQREDEVPMVGRVDWWELQSCVNFPLRKSSDGFIGSSLSFIYPICSMYSIFTYIWVIYGVNVGKYSIHGAYGYGYVPIGSMYAIYGNMDPINIAPLC